MAAQPAGIRRRRAGRAPAEPVRAKRRCAAAPPAEKPLAALAEEPAVVVDLVGDAEPDHPLHETWNSESGRWEPVREVAQEAPDAAAAREPLAGAGA